ncbi:SoxR reducing system RseC family protein [Anaerospora hongkongensis]|uniref:SoxR reducing system RseC family protein n=1 Tax=Anaerospora hongkongensis TaxID=244830 RepID=UPI001FB217D2|nr:SoxR reducing system RseC family protein [Anaerospora hongkongensis]
MKTTRHNDCENCGDCPGNSAIVISVNNALGAKLGQRVAIEVKEVNVLKSAFIVYILPLIAILQEPWLVTVYMEIWGFPQWPPA